MTRTKLDLSIPLLHSFTRSTNSPKAVSKTTAKFDQVSRACFKGVKHRVFQGLRGKKKNRSRKKLLGTREHPRGLFLLMLETARLLFLLFLMWFNRTNKTKHSSPVLNLVTSTWPTIEKVAKTFSVIQYISNLHRTGLNAERLLIHRWLWLTQGARFVDPSFRVSRASATIDTRHHKSYLHSSPFQ